MNYLQRYCINLFLVAGIILLGFACGQKKICPAYQSAFYLSDEVALEDFSYFGADSMPKIENVVRKTDVLLITRIGKKKRTKQMATIPMITVFPETADSLLAQNNEGVSDEEQLEENQEYDQDGNPISKSQKSIVDLKDPEISDTSIVEIPDDDHENLTASEEANRLKKEEKEKGKKSKSSKKSKKNEVKTKDKADKPKEEVEKTEEEEPAKEGGF